MKDMLNYTMSTAELCPGKSTPFVTMVNLVCGPSGSQVGRIRIQDEDWLGCAVTIEFETALVCSEPYVHASTPAPAHPGASQTTLLLQVHGLSTPCIYDRCTHVLPLLRTASCASVRACMSRYRAWIPPGCCYGHTLVNGDGDVRLAMHTGRGQQRRRPKLQASLAGSLTPSSPGYVYCCAHF